ncbi:MAG: aminopeptidase N [Brachymonas sp.]|nr:aminopeptidase N [Brachymonas sp.]
MPALRDDITSAPIIKRADYTPPAFWIDTVELTFDLEPGKTRVLNQMRLRRNPDVAPQPLRLDGDSKALTLSRVLVNGQGSSFKFEDDKLVLENLPEGHEPFQLEIFTTCAPDKNTQLMGLYVSQGTFFTQCEAEGFRRITYFLDRPDVMASYTVTLRADKRLYPVLLSNGNLLKQGDLEDGRHYAIWHDPFKKPSYLFALVAGNLVAREQRIVTGSGKERLLQIYVRPGDLDQTEHALQSLIRSIVWDEVRFGLELDLERFMIVATSDFNMGAMENKGLNIFNTKYVLAKPFTATDLDYDNVESVIAHEYFHNWTGNRITCRDWFQLSLKEGLTVFRDQEFSEDMAATPSARAVRRIGTVRNLRSRQFSEDSGPMAHPVRPDEYQEINNFYTSTVYEKGAEVVRMYQTLAGREGFRKGMDLYFARHDGQAVTCDDFAQCMADANPDTPLAQHLDVFKRWYSQSGTPRVTATGHYNASERSYTLTLRQSCPPTPGQAEKQPFLIPIRMGLLDPQGQPLPLHLAGETDASTTTTTERVLVLTEAEQTFTFTQIDAPPVPSLLRQFSAPVWITVNDGQADELLHLLAHDSDPFNRWEAAQFLIMQQALAALAQPNLPMQVLNEATLAALRNVLRHPTLDAAFKQQTLSLPREDEVAEKLDGEVDPQRIKQLLDAMQLQLATALFDDWVQAYEANRHTGAYRPDPHSTGQRALANLALANLCRAASHNNDAVWPGKAYQRFKDAGNMSDRMGAIEALISSRSPLATQALEQFYALFKNEALVLDKWFRLQACAPDAQGEVLGQVKRLMQHPDFVISNPNRMRSLIFAFCHANPGAFHRKDAAGYVFWADQVLALDAINAHMAADLARALDHWKRLAEPYRSAAAEAIRRVAAKPDLSADVREVVSRALAD